MQGVHFFIHMCLDSGSSSGIDSRAKRTRFPTSLPKVLQQTRVTCDYTIGQRENIKSSNKEIRLITRSPEVWRYLTNKQISWNFIVEKASWWGGYWERLVRSIKTPLKKVIGRSSLNYEMSTLLVEIEAVMNARPITYVYGDNESISYPLTPSDLIYGRRITFSPNSQHYEIMSTYSSLTKRLKHHRFLLGQFTRRWRNEYLTSLREQAAKGSRAHNVNIARN